MKNRKWIALGLVAIMVAAALAGCGEGTQQVASGIIGEVTTPDTYPIETDEVLTYNVRLSADLVDEVINFGDTPYAKELEKRTGIKVEYQHPTIGNEHESFNLMIASGEYPDIFETNWYNNASGPTGAFNDGVIIPLNEAIEKVSPNMKALLEKDPTLEKDISVDGKIYCYPSYIDGDFNLTYYGVMARQDILDEIGMEVPETIDEWEAVLMAMKDKVEYPLYIRLEPTFLSSSSNVLVGAYGIGAGFYVEDGVVKYGPYEEAFKDWVAKMADWYKKGLINTDFANPDSKTVSSNFVNGKIGMTIGSNGSDFGTWLPILRENVEGAEIVPVPYPVLKKGDIAGFGQKSPKTSGYGGSISTQCDNVELAARLLDYGYSPEGQLLCSMGIEGETYEMKDGKPAFLPMVTDSVNLLNKSKSTVLALYSRNSQAPFAAKDEYRRIQTANNYTEPAQLAAASLWCQTTAEEHALPSLTMSAEDSNRLSALRGDIYTYVDENVVNMINGVDSLDAYDAFVAGLEQMGIEEVLDIYQRAYDSYMGN